MSRRVLACMLLVAVAGHSGGDLEDAYQRLAAELGKSESRMDPVLVAFRDQVLYLEHELNAKAIAALERSVAAIEDDVASLIQEIRVSIRETERFLAEEEAA